MSLQTFQRNMPATVLATSANPACTCQRRKLLLAEQLQQFRHPHRRARSRDCPRQTVAAGFVDQPAQLDAEDPQVQAQMEAMAKQMQQPEMQEQLQEAQALMQTPEFAQRVEMLKKDPELAPYFEKAQSGNPSALMKLMSDPTLTQKVMAKLGNVAPPPRAAAPQQAAPNEADAEINNLLDAARHGDLEAAEDFIAIGKDVNAADPDGRTPLHYAVAYDRQDILKVLIEASANLESVDNKQNTPLHYACGYGRGMCVETLIDAGASTHAANASGKTGLDLVKLSDKNPINADDELLELLA